MTQTKRVPGFPDKDQVTHATHGGEREGETVLFCSLDRDEENKVVMEGGGPGGRAEEGTMTGCMTC